MSKTKKFIWLLDSSEPRKGPKLEKNQEHRAADYPAHVVDEWIRTGAAKWVEDSPKSSKKEKD